jgi:hypothetical protein
LYLKLYPWATLSAFALAPAIALLLLNRRRRIRRLGAVILLYGLLHFCAYTALRVPPYQWYYVSLALGVILAGALGLAALQRRWRARPVRFALLGLLPLLPAGLFAGYLLREKKIVLESAPLQLNWATCAEYKKMARELAACAPSGQKIYFPCEIGTLAYYSNLPLMNEFSDRRLTMDMILNSYHLTGVKRTLVSLNFFWLGALPPPEFYPYEMICLPPNLARGRITLHRWNITNRPCGPMVFMLEKRAPPQSPRRAPIPKASPTAPMQVSTNEPP